MGRGASSDGDGGSGEGTGTREINGDKIRVFVSFWSSLRNVRDREHDRGDGLVQGEGLPYSGIAGNDKSWSRMENGWRRVSKPVWLFGLYGRARERDMVRCA